MAEAARKPAVKAVQESAEIAPLHARGPSPSTAEAPKAPPAAGATQNDSSTTGSDGDGSKPKGNDRRKKLLVVAGAIAAVVIFYYGLNWLFVGRYLVSTDNAYVGADMSIVAPRVSGYVANVSVPANAKVKAGDVLVTLDDGDYRLAVEQAAARLATQDASIERLQKQIVAAQAAVEQSKASLAATEADQRKADADFARTDQLTQNQFASKATYDAVRAARDRAQAMVLQARAAVAAADANHDVLKAQKTEAERTRRELEAVLAKAQRDLDATVIRAPFDGVIGNKSVQVGDYVSPGKRLLALVPLQGVYVDANFKETQLSSIQIGQKVKLILDADSANPLEGVVDSFAPASGALFSLLPPENATGNFTKIVQRLTVRVRVLKADERLLLPGLSVVATVDTRTTPKDKP
ncbi:MAG: HlyD family secretion protein [Xanthobacteraceae bacterium]|nr:HlyD family secretion protein [Xanthobacteraceae bacterium]MBX3535571.1 HlyD family secretion protein [Xanthobacteraceae bacterium]MBX3550535.1 HlyD family secretion protein [Xanthobacteraceae bacterium]MCW5678490.1 HlyD family secretion protein [Xanthobacteraceae bacterium]